MAFALNDGLPREAIGQVHMERTRLIGGSARRGSSDPALSSSTEGTLETGTSPLDVEPTSKHRLLYRVSEGEIRVVSRRGNTQALTARSWFGEGQRPPSPRVTPSVPGSTDQEAVVTITASSHGFMVPAGEPHRLVCTADKATVLYARVPASHETAVAIAAPPDPAALAADEASLRNYVDAARQDLRDMFGDTGGYSEEAYAKLVAFQEQETVEREELVCRFAVRAEYINRYIIEALEKDAFQAIRSEKHNHFMLPWCTMSCSYCCSTRPEWEEHVGIVYRSMRQQISTFEAEGRTSVEGEWAAGFAALTAQLRVCMEMTQHHVFQRDLVQAEERSDRHAILKEEEHRFSVFIADFAEVIRNRELRFETGELREKFVEVRRIEDSLNLQERRVARRQVILVLEEEQSAREFIRKLGEQRFEYIVHRAAREQAMIEGEMRAAEIHMLQKEREELQAFKEEMIRKQEKAEAQKRRAAQEILEKEYAEVKKLKRQGPPKGVTMPDCPLCKQQPVKDYYSHRLNECPDRPIMCTKCNAIMKISDQEAHKPICPGRVLQCEKCTNHFKAGYLEHVHTSKCETIAEARDKLISLTPKLPFEFFKGSAPDTTHIKLDPASAHYSSIAAVFKEQHTLTIKSETFKLLGLAPMALHEGRNVPTNDNPATNITDPLSVGHFIAKHTIGVGVDTTGMSLAEVLRLDASGGPPLRIGEPFACRLETTGKNPKSVWLNFNAVTSIDLGEWRDLMFQVQADESQYCKPQLEKKGKKKK